MQSSTFPSSSKASQVLSSPGYFPPRSMRGRNVICSQVHSFKGNSRILSNLEKEFFRLKSVLSIQQGEHIYLNAYLGWNCRLASSGKF